MDAGASALTVSIELEPQSEPIGGRLIPPEGEPTRFDGWIELVAELNRWIEANRPEGHAPG